MAKKKAAGVSRFKARETAPAQAFDPKASRAKKLVSAEDAFGGDEDEFHANRDEVLFEMDGKEARGGMDVLDSDDEIYGLNLPDNSSEEEAIEEDDDEEVLGEDEDGDEEQTSYPPREASPPRGRFAKDVDPTQDILSDAESVADAAESSDEETWAPHMYHVSRKAPGEADSEDDEALDMEAEEARRLQKKYRGVLAGEDYGFGEEAEDEGELETVRQQSRLGGRLEDAATAAAGLVGDAPVYQSEEEAISFLLKKQPETLALLDDFSETAERMKNVEKALVIVRQGEDGKEHPALAIMELEHQAMSTYLPTLAFYFSLLLAPSPSPELLAKVLVRLTSIRSALATMEELDLTAGNMDSSDEDSSEEDDDDSKMLASQAFDLGGGDDMEEDDDDGNSEEEEEITDSMLGGLEDSELEELMKDMADDADAEALIARVKQVQRAKLGLPPLEAEPTQEAGKKKRGRKSKAEKRIAAREAAAEARGGVYTSKSSTNVKNVLSLGPLLPPLASSSRGARASTSRIRGDEDDLLESTSLSLTDQSDKASRKHTLRFHVSQVHQKSVKRESGGKERVGGDDDLPRAKSKEAQRREVLKRQEHGGAKTGEALDGMDWDEQDKREAEGASGGGDEGEEYYDLVKREKREGKVAKQVEYDDARGAEKAALDDLSEASAAGPRGATRKILANKGLTPKRAKVNRNPRVKKRLRYDKAVKKVATMKAVFKGGMSTLGHGEYAGEKSGIGSKVVKSVRLGK